MNSDAKDLSQKDIKRKTFRKRCIVAAVLVILFILWVISYKVFMPTRAYSGDVDMIRVKAALQLNKNYDQLKNEDFVKIRELDLSEQWISDIELLKKFTNLTALNLSRISFKRPYVPQWKKILSRIGIVKLTNKKFLDLSPLENLTKLRHLNMYGIQNNVNDISSLSNLSNLVVLNLEFTNVSDLKPLDACRKLEILNINSTKITDIETITNFQNLHTLYMNATQVSDFEPLKKLANLEILYIVACEKITDEQVEDLQKALPNLKIIRDTSHNRR